MLLLTDSKSESHSQAVSDAQALQNGDDNVRMFAVYWGDPGLFTASFVKSYVSEPDSDYFIQAASVADSISKLVAVVDSACTVCAQRASSSQAPDPRARACGAGGLAARVSAGGHPRVSGSPCSCGRWR